MALRFADTELFKTGFWSQGPAELQTLALMAQHDLANIGFGTPDYCHLLVEAMTLAYADREQYYGDPAMAQVPARTLLSPPKDWGPGTHAGLLRAARERAEPRADRTALRPRGAGRAAPARP